MSNNLGVGVTANTVIVGDVRSRLKDIASSSIDCVITSPPYFQLRDYGVENQMGSEPDVLGWVSELRLVLRGLSRVLKPTGSIWLNLGDSFSRHGHFGAPPKSLLLGPERLALALIEDGWIVRNKVIWAKSRPMPASVKDRLTSTWEVIYLLTRSRHYYFDLDAIRVPHLTSLNHPALKRPAKALKAYPMVSAPPPKWAGRLAGNNSGLVRLKSQGLSGHPLGKNPGDVWKMPSANFRGEHFATFPPHLIERPLLASCPEKVCVGCGIPWQRGRAVSNALCKSLGKFAPSCKCNKRSRRGLVLDPFFGVGTVGLVAEQFKRDWLGIELNPKFANLAMERIKKARCKRQSRAKRINQSDGNESS